MKYFFLVLFAISIEWCKANDTLTRAQVYDFSVGDSFDYLITSYNSAIMESYTGFKREIIINIYHSPSSDTLFIEKRVITFSYSNSRQETSVITNLQEYEIYHANTLGCLDTTYTMDNTSQYNDRKLNESICYGGLESVYEENRFVEGLGIVYNHTSFGNPNDGFYDGSKELMYYAKDTETWGTLLPVGIGEPNMEQEQAISVYPAINSGTFNISMDYLPSETELQLFDIYGRCVLTSEIQNRLSVINMEEFTPGFYIWRLTARDKILRTGKVMME